MKDKSKSKRRKLERELATAIKPKNVLPKDAFRVEHLNYKRLVPTTKVLAQIITIRPLELIVSLPNQLLGHIPITAISSEYTERLEIEGEESSEEEDVSEDEALSEAGSSRQKGGLPGLMDLFKVGDWVSAIVVNSKVSDSKAKLGGRTGDENVRAARRIELSLEPEKVNEGIAKGDLRTGFVRHILAFLLKLNERVLTIFHSAQKKDSHVRRQIDRRSRLYSFTRSTVDYCIRIVQRSEETAAY